MQTAVDTKQTLPSRQLVKIKVNVPQGMKGAAVEHEWKAAHALLGRTLMERNA